MAFGPQQRVYSDDAAVSDINSKCAAWYLTMGLVFVKDR